MRVEEFSEALSARLHAELDEIPVPERDWIGALPDLGRRVRNRRLRHGVAAAVAIAVVASAVILAGPATGHGRGRVPAEPAKLTPLASMSFREPCCGPSPAADLTYGNGWLFAQLMTQDQDRLVRLNPRSLRVTGSLQGGSSMPVYADGAVWVVSSRRTLWRINPATLRISRRIPIRGQVNALAVGDGALWLAVCPTRERDGNCRGGSQRLERIDPASGQVTAWRKLPVASGWLDLAVGRVILVSGEGSPVYAINPHTLTLRQTFHVNCDGCQGATGVAVGPGGLYAVSINRVVRLSLASGRTITRGPQLPFSFAGSLEAAGGSLWLGTEQGTFRLDPVTLAPTAPVIAGNDRLLATGDTEHTVVAGGSVYVSYSGGLARYSASVSR